MASLTRCLTFRVLPKAGAGQSCLAPIATALKSPVSIGASSGSGPQSHNQVRLFHDWTDRLTLFADGHDIPPDIRADLARRNVPVVDGRITKIAHPGGHNATVKLDAGPNVAVDIL